MGQLFSRRWNASTMEPLLANWLRDSLIWIITQAYNGRVVGNFETNLLSIASHIKARAHFSPCYTWYQLNWWWYISNIICLLHYWFVMFHFVHFFFLATGLPRNWIWRRLTVARGMVRPRRKCQCRQLIRSLRISAEYSAAIRHLRRPNYCADSAPEKIPESAK